MKKSMRSSQKPTQVADGFTILEFATPNAAKVSMANTCLPFCMTELVAARMIGMGIVMVRETPPIYANNIFVSRSNCPLKT